MLILTSDKLPFCAFVHVPSNEPSASVGVVRRGVGGYWPATNPEVLTLASHEEAKALVHALNSEKGITPIQSHCMLVGSMFGWESPGADPDTYSANDPARFS